MFMRIFFAACCTVLQQEDSSELVIREDVVYARPGEIELKLDYAFSESAPKPRPVLLMIHGEGWRFRQVYRPWMNEAASRGFFAASIDYRLAPEHPWPAALEDFEAAISWIEQHEDELDLDSERIAAIGSAAGGRIALLLGSLSLQGRARPRVACVAHVAGNYVISQVELPTQHLLVDPSGDSPADELDLEQVRSSISAGDAPVFSMIGESDPLVKATQLRSLHEKLSSLHIPNELKVVRGTEHGLILGKGDLGDLFDFIVPYAHCSSLALLARVDFDKPEDLERFETTDESCWKVEACLSLHRKESSYQPPVRSPVLRAILRGPEVHSFVLDVRARSTHPDYGHRDLCLFFGYQDETHFYYAHLAPQADPNAHGVFLVNGAPRVNIATDRTGGVEWKDHWHRLQVRRDTTSGAIEVYFDDLMRPVIRAVDTTLLHGRVGVGSFDDTGDFDALRLWGEPASPATEKNPR